MMWNRNDVKGTVHIKWLLLKPYWINVNITSPSSTNRSKFIKTARVSLLNTYHVICITLKISLWRFVFITLLSLFFLCGSIIEFHNVMTMLKLIWTSMECRPNQSKNNIYCETRVLNDASGFILLWVFSQYCFYL